MSRRKKLDATILADAVSAVKSGVLSLRGAEEAYEINRESIRRAVLSSEEGKMIGNGAGRPTLIPQEIELRLVEYIDKRGDMNIGPSAFQLRKKGMELLKASPCGDSYLSQRKRHDLLGKDWLRAFMKRHILSRHTPQPLELSRVGIRRCRCR